MKIIIEAANFVPSIYLQAFIMKRSMALNRLQMNIPLVKIRIDIEGKYYLCAIIINSKIISIQIIESSKDIFKAFTKALSLLENELKKRKKLKLVFGSEMKPIHSYLLRNNDLYYFNEN